MIYVKRLTITVFVSTSILTSVLAQENVLETEITSTSATATHPSKWNLRSCIDYALQQNITIRKNQINAASSIIDVKTAKAALFPSLSFSTSQNVRNNPHDQTGSIISGDKVMSNSNKTSYNGNYGLNASWTLYNGNKRLNTIKQEKINSQVAELEVATSANNIQESVAQIYIQILYAMESVKINEHTLELSTAQRDRGKELLKAGSIAQSDYAQLEAQVSTDKYQLVTAKATLQDYKLQLKQLLELEGDIDINIEMPILSEENILLPLPEKQEVYLSALQMRPEIQAGKLNIESSEIGIDIAKAGYIPTISLSAGIGSNHINSSDFTFSEQLKNNWSNTIGISVSVPIFNNRQTKSAIQKAKLQKETNQLSLQEEQKNLYKAIENLWLEANSAQQRYSAANEKLKSTKTSYELLTEQFNLGMKNTIELLTERNNFLQAQQEQLQAKYMAILNIQLLKFYQGNQLAL